VFFSKTPLAMKLTGRPSNELFKSDSVFIVIPICLFSPFAPIYQAKVVTNFLKSESLSFIYNRTSNPW
jgi:hypothetical protein